MDTNARRQFLKTSLLSAASLSSLNSLNAFAKETEMMIKGDPVKDVKPSKIGKNLYAIYAAEGFPTKQNQGFMSNIIFTETSKGVVIIDSGASVQIGEMALRQIKTITDKPVIAIINSHYHGDHWMGNHAFVAAYKDIPIYALKESGDLIRGAGGKSWVHMMEQWTDGATAGTIATPPNQTIKHGQELKFGDTTLKIHHYGAAHTPSDAVIELPENKLTYIGDVAMDGRIANMDDGTYQGTFKFYDALEKNIKANNNWLPGHGRLGKNVIKENRILFEGIWAAALKAVENFDTPDMVKKYAMEDKRVKDCANWEGFDGNIGKYSSIAFLEAEQAS